MTRNITEAFRGQLGAEYTTDPFAWLLEIRVPTDPVTRYRLCNQKRVVEYGENSAGEAITYYPAGFTVSTLEETSDGSLPEIKVEIGNASLELRQTLEDYNGLVDQDVILRLVNLALLNDTGHGITWQGQMGEPTITAQGISFTISAVNLTERTFPGRRHVAAVCKHPKFGEGACPYPVADAGAAYSTCPRSYEACVARGTDMVSLGYDDLLPLRFGGELGIGRRR